MSKTKPYDIMNSRVADACARAGHKTCRVFYSAYETDADDEPVDNLDEVAARGPVMLWCPRTQFWGGAQSRAYQSEVLTDPTWLEVAVHANAAIRQTRDTHHTFLEGVSPAEAGWEHDEDPPDAPEGVTVLEIDMGS